MSDPRGEYGDPLSRPFWEAAARRELSIQRCESCGAHQFYPRPYCLACYSDSVRWVAASGRGTVYSQTTIMMADPPYTVALIDLDEGPRMLAGIAGGAVDIGDRVTVTWAERDEAPPLPMFERA